MTALELLARAKACGVSIRPDGAELGVRYQDDLPEGLLSQLLKLKPEVLALLSQDHVANDPTACRGCGEVIR